MLRNKALTAQNGTIQQSVSPDGFVQAMAQTGSTSPATAVFVMEVSVNGTDFYGVKMDDPADSATPIANLTGTNKVGMKDVSGAVVIRMRRTDSTAGNGDISLNLAEQR